MSNGAGQTDALWPMAVYFFAALGLAAAMIGLSYLLGQRHKERQTDEPYESGIAPTGSARLRFDVKFYLIAVFFVIFDIESVFVLAWSVAYRESGWTGYGGIVFFVATLAAALVYLWRLGALEWGTTAAGGGHRSRRERDIRKA